MAGCCVFASRPCSAGYQRWTDAAASLTPCALHIRIRGERQVSVDLNTTPGPSARGGTMDAERTAWPSSRPSASAERRSFSQKHTPSIGPSVPGTGARDGARRHVQRRTIRARAGLTSGWSMTTPATSVHPRARGNDEERIHEDHGGVHRAHAVDTPCSRNSTTPDDPRRRGLWSQPAQPCWSG